MNKGYGVFVLICLLLTPAWNARAQVGNCEPGTAEAELDFGDVRARLFNNGNLFWGGSPHVYEVPKGGGVNAIFAANIWVAGLINNELHSAGSTYSPWEFWPGPLDDAGNPPDNCADFDQIWEINYLDLLGLRNRGEISDNIQNWPWQLGAPVADGDGIPDNYNVAGGDEPELLGHQRFWWVMNDRGNERERFGRDPIGLEVHASAFSFINTSFADDDTFYKFRLINKNEHALEEAYFSFWVDSDLGNFDDDYSGSDSLLHLGYFYNADNDDEGGENYGIAPPAVGISILDAPLAPVDGIDNDRDGEIDEAGETLAASSVMIHQKGGDPRTGDPDNLFDMYNYMQARWKDNEPLVKGAIGYPNFFWPEGLPQIPTRFSYSGDPITAEFWSKRNIDNNGLAEPPSDQRLLITSGPFTLASFDTVDVALAIIWARGNDNLDSVIELKKQVQSIQSTEGSVLGASNNYAIAGFGSSLPTPPAAPLLSFDQNYPNPFSQATTIRYSLPKSMRVKLTVFDVLGRELEVLVDGQKEAGSYEASFQAGNYPAGIYLAQIQFDHLRFTRTMMLVR